LEDFGPSAVGKRKSLRKSGSRRQSAIDALALVYESKFIFDHIRSEATFAHEWKDIPATFGSTEEQRQARAPFYATLKRIQANKDFFERAWKMQVRCTALSGPQVEETFLLVQRARRQVEVSAEMLLHDPEPQFRSEDNIETWNGFRADVWGAYGKLSRQTQTRHGPVAGS
jgi:hypothetical protein